MSTATTPNTLYFTYNGPSVSAAFVTGVFNDAWNRAIERAASAKTAFTALTPQPPALNTALIAPMTAGSGSYSVPTAPVQTPDVENLKAAFEAQLRQMLSDFVTAHYPTYTLPDAAAAWQRVAATFDGEQIEPVIQATHNRIDDVWTARGYTLPQQVSEYQHRYIERRAADIRTNAAKNTSVILYAHLQEVNLVKFEMVMSSQLDALNAARTFLLQCIVPMRAKVDEDQLRTVLYRTELMSAHWRYLEALIEADGMALERLLVNRRISVDSALSTEARKAFVFRELSEATIAEVDSIVQQSTAAIGQIHARTGIGGGESL